MHDTFLAFSKTSKQAQRRIMREGFKDEATRQQFRSQFRRWKEHTSNILQPEELESMYGGFETFFKENPPPPITPTKLEPPREQPLVEETPRTLIKSYLSLGNEPPVTPPKAPVAPVSDAQKMLTPPQLNQYPSWNQNNVSTPLRGSAQPAIEMSNMIDNMKPIEMSNMIDNMKPPFSPAYKLPEQWNYNHPTNVSRRAQAAANSQFFKQNELLSQKYAIPLNSNPKRYNEYPLNLQRVLRTHFPGDTLLRNSVAFNEQQVDEIKRARKEDLVDLVDYYLSQNYPKQNQQPIPDAPVNERSSGIQQPIPDAPVNERSSGIQPLEIDNQSSPEVSEDFGTGYDSENIMSEMANVGESFIG
jgi:hypothetical protein